MDDRERLILELSCEVPADDVMDENAVTKCAFTALEVGHFERQGPNSWDPSRLVLEDRAEMRVFPGVQVRAEISQGWFRMRFRGAVSMFEWVPENVCLADGAERQAAFVAECLDGFQNPAGVGAAAIIARKLDGD